jgi:hypothetical protein
VYQASVDAVTEQQIAEAHQRSRVQDPLYRGRDPGYGRPFPRVAGVRSRLSHGGEVFSVVCEVSRATYQ